MASGERIEHDLLGDRAVPAGAYYGVHTLRAAGQPRCCACAAMMSATQAVSFLA